MQKKWYFVYFRYIDDWLLFPWTRIKPIERIGCAMGFDRWTEDNTDNDDNCCMTKVMCEEKVFQVVPSCLKKNRRQHRQQRQHLYDRRDAWEKVVQVVPSCIRKNRRQHRQRRQHLYDRSDVRGKSCPSCHKLSLERIEDNTDNNDNTCMTEGMREKKVVKVVPSCL